MAAVFAAVFLFPGVAVASSRTFIGAMIQATLFSDLACSPWFNMAADEYLLHEASRRSSAIFIRLYTWQPGAITFGYNQSIERAVDLGALGDTPLIRRITGGRALYHDPSELTYSVVFSQSEELVKRLGATIAETQSRLAEVLGAFLRAEGIDSKFSRVESSRERDRTFVQSAPCFASAGRYELVSHRGKVAASAQRRTNAAVLQHGSIKIAGLSSHPALRLAAPQHGAESPLAMNDNSFRRRVTSFGEVFTRLTSIPVGTTDYTPEQVIAIRSWADVVRKKPTEGRDIFKQCSTKPSL